MNATVDSPTSAWHDVVIVLLAAICFFVLGSLGAGLLARSFLSGGVFIGEPAIAAAYWLQWGCKIIGRFGGDYLCGFLLGRYLRRINPWHLAIVFPLYYIGILVVNRGFFDAHQGFWLQTIGPVGAIFQKGSQIVFMVTLMCWGIWHGQRSVTAERRPAGNRYVFFRIGTVFFDMVTAIPWLYAVVMLSYAVRYSSYELASFGINAMFMGIATLSAARSCQTERWHWLLISIVVAALCLGHMVLFIDDY